MKLNELSVKRPVAVTMVVLIFLVIGIYSLTMLPMESMPDMDLSMAIVNTTYSNVGANEMENLVTKKIESAVSSISGVDTIQSQSSEGRSLVMVQFANGTDMDQAVSDMKSNIDMYRAMLPDDCDDPMVVKMDMSMMPVAMMSVSYEGYDLVQTKKFVEDNLQDRLESISGVASVNITGATDRIIEVRLNPTQMSGYSLNLSDVMKAIASQNNNFASGSVSASSKDMTIRTIGEFDSLSDIENVTVTTQSGEVIHVRDVAEVVDTYDEDESYARLNGENAISVSISSESDANTVDVVDAVEKQLDDLQAQHPKFQYNMTMEQASYIKNSISSVAQNAILGGVLAVLILFLFLGSMRTALVIGITMPVSIFTTFIGMYFAGMTLNTVSLGGLALGVGMLVDCSVVVIENIFRRRDELGEDPATAAMKGSGEVFGAVIASVITTCIVYVPILFIDNMMAIMFKQLAFAIIFSQLASLLVTFLLIPMLSARIPAMNDAKKHKLLMPFDKAIEKMYVVYEKGLRRVLKHRKSFIAAVIAVFAGAMVILGSLGMTIMPSTDEGTIDISLETPDGTKLENTDELTRKVEDIIMARDDVETVFSSVGGSGIMQSGSNSSSITVTLLDDRDKTTNDVCQEIRDALKNITGATFEVNASSSGGMSVSSDEVEWQFSATDDEQLEKYVNDCEDRLKMIKGVSETSTSSEDTKSEVRINIDSDKAARYGMTSQQVSTYVKYATDGSKASEYKENGSEYDINVVYPDNYLSTVSALKHFQIKAPTGQWISLSDIATVVVDRGSTTLTRIDRKRTITLSAKLYGTDMQTVNMEFNKAIADVQKPDGISRETGGSLEIMVEAMVSLVLAILLGILLMYFVMAAQFENMIQPAIILMTVPLSIIGVALSLLVSGSELSVVGCIGILMLIGIIVNNAIVLIDFINTLKREEPDGSIIEHVIKAGKTRMRPVLMTSLTSILGYLPMAVSTAEGSETMKPLAIVLLGGLAVGTLLTLFVIPVIYTMFEKRRMRRQEKKAGRKAKLVPVNV
ncbi:MAG: efflux RND transporter permease subunit [Clostridiales bacterium]|nr:efflux RND transporter permease subunit [Clostridiales bacterium]